MYDIVSSVTIHEKASYAVKGDALPFLFTASRFSGNIQTFDKDISYCC